MKRNDKVNTLSARVMSELRAARKEKGGTKKDASDFVTLGELWALAASKGGRETTDRVSRIAAKVMRIAASKNYSPDSIRAWDGGDVVMMRDLVTLAGSCLAQDTTPGDRLAAIKAAARDAQKNITGKRPAKRGRK